MAHYDVRDYEAEFLAKVERLRAQRGLSFLDAATEVAKGAPAAYDQYRSAVMGAPVPETPVVKALTDDPYSPRALAWTAITDRAEAWMLTHRDISREEAIVQVITDDPALYAQWRAASGARPTD